MKTITCSMLASLLLLTACGSDKSKAPATAPPKPAPVAAEKPATPPAPAPAPAKPAAPVAPPAAAAKPATSLDIDLAYKELMAKPEQAVPSIEIQHILIGFKGAPRLDHVTRSKEEAKVLAQKVFDEARAGADFLALVKQYTDDSPPGIYPLDQTSRKQMVKSFGDVGWRLQVGEIGIAVWDAQASPFGWHIIKRLK